MKKQGAPIGSNTVTAFEKLASFAATDDAALNRMLRAALVASGLAHSFEDEVGLRGTIDLRSDVLVETTGGKVRLEVMWRKKTSRAGIANYVLTKLQCYGRAIGYLS